jgi:hypothetical protein
LFFVNYLTDGNDDLRKVVRRKNGNLRSVGEVGRCELRAAVYEERVTGCEVQVGGAGKKSIVQRT